MKKFLIHLLDKIDNSILGHRCYWVCQWVSLSSWWGEEDCVCTYCLPFKHNVLE